MMEEKRRGEEEEYTAAMTIMTLMPVKSSTMKKLKWDSLRQ